MRWVPSRRALQPDWVATAAAATGSRSPAGPPLLLVKAPCAVMPLLCYTLQLPPPPKREAGWPAVQRLWHHLLGIRQMHGKQVG